MTMSPLPRSKERTMTLHSSFKWSGQLSCCEQRIFSRTMGYSRGQVHYLLDLSEETMYPYSHITRKPTTILHQVINHLYFHKRDKKKVHFAILFHILKSSALCWSLRVLVYCMTFSCSKKLQDALVKLQWLRHGSVYVFDVKSAICKDIIATSFIAIFINEVTTIDNGSCISSHAYVVKNQIRIPYLVTLEQVVDGTAAHSLTFIMTKALQSDGRLNINAIASRWLYFKKNGVNTFQRT